MMRMMRRRRSGRMATTTTPMARWAACTTLLVALTGCEPVSSAPAAETQAPSDAGFFRSGSDSLHYVLDLPPGTAPADARVPAFVMVHGSGRQTKAYNRSISDPLVSDGMIALRYDKRGTGQSSGAYFGVGIGNSPTAIRQLADDVLAAVEVLRAHPRVDPDRIGLVGVSQAGWIVPEAMSRSQALRWSILFVGPTVSVGEEIYYSRLADGTTRPFSELSDSLAAYTGPHGYDPRPALNQIDAPGLWLLGAADRSIPTAESEQILAELAASGRPFEWVVYPGAGHCLSCTGPLPIREDMDRWLRERGIRR